MYLIGNQPFGKPYVKTNQNSSRPAKTNMAPTAEPKRFGVTVFARN